jgi:hypothetical protein
MRTPVVALLWQEVEQDQRAGPGCRGDGVVALETVDGEAVEDRIGACDPDGGGQALDDDCGAVVDDGDRIVACSAVSKEVPVGFQYISIWPAKTFVSPFGRPGRTQPMRGEGDWMTSDQSRHNPRDDQRNGPYEVEIEPRTLQDAYAEFLVDDQRDETGD